MEVWEVSILLTAVGQEPDGARKKGIRFFGIQSSLKVAAGLFIVIDLAKRDLSLFAPRLFSITVLF